MILSLDEKITREQQKQLMERLEWMGLHAVLLEDQGKPGIAIVQGGDALVDFSQFKALPFVEKVAAFTHPYKLASRQVKPQKTVISVKGKTIGGEELAIMAGPCSIESEEQIFSSARIVASQGATFLRGGAFKPRTSPYAFQGMGEAGLQLLQKAGATYGLVTISEVMDASQIDLVANYSDLLQIGARNMQNFSLLKQLGRVKNPVMLKRGLSATYQDLLMSAEYILNAGNPHVILCERGIRTYETYTRNTLDLAAVPILQELSHLPVIIDPSHGVGIRRFVTPMARAAVAAGADGIMVEVHPEPTKAFSDADQTLSPEEFTVLMQTLREIAPVLKRRV